MRTDDPTTPSRLPAIPAAKSPAAIGPLTPPQTWFDPSKENEGFDLSAFLHALRRKWLPGLGLGCLVASLLAGLLWYLIPVNYEAFTVFRVGEAQSGILGRRASYNSNEHEIFREQQAALIKGNFVIRKALQETGIEQLRMVRRERQPEAWLERELRADYVRKSDILRVSLSGEDQDETKKLLNAVAKAYMDEVVFKERTEKADDLNLLRKKKRTSLDEMDRKLAEIMTLAEKMGSHKSDQVKQRYQLEFEKLQARSHRKQVLEAEVGKARVEAFLAQQALQMRDDAVRPWEIRDVLRGTNPEYALIENQMLGLKEGLRFASNSAYGASSGAAYQTQIAELKQELKRMERKNRNEAQERILALKGIDGQVDEQFVLSLRSRLQLLAEDLKLANDSYQEQLTLVEEFGGYSSRLDMLETEVSGLQDLTNEITQRITELEMEVGQESRVQQLHPATIPDANSFWLKVAQVGGAWWLALISTVLGVAFWDFQKKHVNTSKDVSGTQGDLRVIGSLPQLAARFRTNQKALELALTRSIDGIRATLLYARSKDAAQVFMVTSALGQEGKTTVASQLAVSLAKSGRRTLLIDGDIRNPQQHLVLGMQFDHGLCELLRSQLPIDDVVRATAAEGLWTLLAGYRDLTTDQGLSSDQFASLMKELRSRFDFIVVDSGPVLTSADPLLIGQHADLALVSVRRDVSRTEKVQDACDRLKAVGIKLFGAVLNGGSADIRRSELVTSNGKPQKQPQLEEASAYSTTNDDD